ncbi:MAG: SAM-dependent methyltransferase [Bacteroidales bacterium]|nr:SAM-dependent methyltransferase [Bacteroidales bacterium]
MTERGKLYLIPTPLGDYEPSLVLPAPVFEVIAGLKTFVVEEVRTARRFLSAAGLKGHISELDFHELNEHTAPKDVEAFARLFDGGNDVGLLSEAGLPAVADPGALLVALCHREGIEVVPLTGPSSLMLALMASGLNGQSFAFNGYLPVKPEERRTALKNLEKRSASLHQSQIFIETPYRNDSMLADVLATCSGHTKLCVAADITLASAYIKTRTVEQWKRDVPQIGKRPCVFIILA